jgi:hypothetical protein
VNFLSRLVDKAICQGVQTFFLNLISQTNNIFSGSGKVETTDTSKFLFAYLSVFSGTSTVFGQAKTLGLN